MQSYKEIQNQCMNLPERIKANGKSVPRCNSKKAIVDALLRSTTNMQIKAGCFLVNKDDRIDDKLSTTGLNIRKLTSSDWAHITALATEFVTNHVLETHNIDTQMKIVTYIRKTFSPVLVSFARKHGFSPEHIHFLYKGGNVMRFLLRSLAQKNADMLSKIHKEYGSVFKPSDMDFGVSIDYELLKKDGIELNVNDIHQLSHQIFNKLRMLRKMWTNQTKTCIDGCELSGKEVFPILKLDEKEIRLLFEDMKKKMNKVVEEQNKVGVILPTIEGISSLGTKVPYIRTNPFLHDANRSDITIHFSDDMDMTSARVVCEKKDISPSSLFISKNTSLKFSNDMFPQYITHFDLIRMKLAVSLHVSSDDEEHNTKSIGAEVIDISITHPDQISLESPIFVDLENNELQPYAKYTMILEDGTQEWFHSYSLAMLIFDLIKTVFYTYKHPWNDPKYNKRLKRLSGLLLCYYMQEKGTNEEKMKAMLSVISKDKSNQIGRKMTIWQFVHAQIQPYHSQKKPEASELINTIKECLNKNKDIITYSETPFDSYTMLQF